MVSGDNGSGNGKDETKRELPELELLESELEYEKYKSRYRGVLKSTVFSLVVIAAAAALAAMLLFPVLQISGTSMADSLHDGDIVLALNGRKYGTGDIVAFYFGNDILVKRVIAGPGDWVNIDAEGNVFVNDVKLDEPYVTEKSLGDCNIELPYQVPDERWFVMGDHRDTSVDSRNTAVGCVSGDMVIGRILFRVLPLEDFGGIN